MDAQTKAAGIDETVRLIRATPAIVNEIMAVCGITRPAIWQWRQVPRDRVLAVAKIMGIKPYVIRPDFYPPPTPKRRPVPSSSQYRAA